MDEYEIRRIVREEIAHHIIEYHKITMMNVEKLTDMVSSNLARQIHRNKTLRGS